MRVSPPPSEIRKLVAQTFSTLGVSAKHLANLSETVLLDKGRYAARSYRAEGFMAMWLVQVGIIQFYNEQGDMLGTVNLFEERELQRVAA